MTGNDLIRFASQLVLQPDPKTAELRYRTAVSRAYYGAFHLAVDFLAEIGYTVKENYTGHVDAARVLLNSGFSKAVEASRAMDDLRKHRNDADYKLKKKGMDNQRNTMDRIGMASNVAICLDACRGEPGRSRIIASIKTIK